MIPPVKLGSLALGLAGWSRKLEGGIRVSYGAALVMLFTVAPLSLSPKSNILPGLAFGGQVSESPGI
jgi:hypothetical protein